MPEDLKLSLERQRPRNERKRGLIAVVLILLFAVTVSNLVLQISGTPGKRPSFSGLSPQELEGLALKLEKQQLSSAAARTWTEYMGAAGPGRDERARLWYRIGKLYQDAGDCERALEAYYRSEKLVPLAETASEISIRTAECLEILGKFAALTFELEERTAYAGGDSLGGSDVVAEIGPRKISRAQLDMMIEAEIDAQLSQLPLGLSPQERRAQKERLLEGVLKEGERGRWLERLIAEELLYRRAREEKLHESEEFRSLSRNIECKLLAQKYLERAYAASVTVTPEEMKKYYESHEGDFEADGAAKPFDEVKDQVYMAVRAQKEMEVQRQVLEGLMSRYDVVIHRSKLGGK